MRGIATISWDLQLEEPIGLEELCERATQGTYGTVSPEEFAAFPRAIGGTILANIETKLEESPRWSHLRDEKIEKTTQMIQELLEKYASG